MTKKFTNTSFNRWMTSTAAIQQSSLADITIPGAHDAGMGKVTQCSTYAGADVTQTQNLSFIQMLNAGTRYFDIRPIINKSGDMYLGHFSWIGKNISIIKTFTLRNEGCFGYSVDEMLDDVKKFVSEKENKEVIILNFSHFMNFKKFDNENSHFDKEDFNKLQEKINKQLNGYLVLSNKNFINTKISKLTHDGAKVLVIFDINGYEGKDGIYSNNEKYFNLYDSYSDTNNYNKMKKDQFRKMNKYSESTYFILSWTLTQNDEQAIASLIGSNMPIPDFLSIHYLASIANNHLSDIQRQVEKTQKYPNVIYTDYNSDKQTKLAISINQLRNKFIMDIDISNLISKRFGGNSGSSFEMRGVTSIQLRAGDWIDAIVINDIQHGGGGSDLSETLTFDDDNYEYISKIEIQTGQRDGSEVITYLKITKQNGKYIEGGLLEGEPNMFTGKILALGGRSGKYLDQIEVFGELEI